MNQSIRCEPPLFPLASDKAAVAGAALFSKAAESPGNDAAEFRDVLDSEIEEQKDEKREPKNPDACAAYVVVPTVIQLLQEVPLAVATELPTGSVQPLPSESSEEQSPPEQGGTNSSTDGESGAVPLIETLKPAEHKLPMGFERAGEKVAEFAENKAEQAKMASGTVGAQQAAMLSAKPKSEETAPKQSLLLGTENFEASSFEQPITI